MEIEQENSDQQQPSQIFDASSDKWVDNPSMKVSKEEESEEEESEEEKSEKPTKKEENKESETEEEESEESEQESETKESEEESEETPAGAGVMTDPDEVATDGVPRQDPQVRGLRLGVHLDSGGTTVLR